MDIKSSRSRGFSLIEVMVALVVVAIGLLGLAKMESLAIASTTVAGSRSIAAMQAASMAAAMHANRAYWASTVTTPVQTIVTNATATGTAPTACTSAGACASPTAVATYDLYNWAVSMNATMPAFYASIDCTVSAVPVNCTITINWTETGVAINAQQTTMANLKLPTYQVYVEP